MEALRAIVTTPVHLNQFLEKVGTPKWLEPITETFYGSAQSDIIWLQPILNAAIRLAENAPKDVTAYLRVLCEQSSKDANYWRFVCRAALIVGGDALKLVLKILRGHKTDPMIGPLALMAARKVDPADPLVEDFADHLLGHTCWPQLIYQHQELIDHMVSGIESTETAQRRIRLLCYKINEKPVDSKNLRLIERDRPESIAVLADYEDRNRLLMLVNALCKALERASDWEDLAFQLNSIDSVHTVIKGRVRAWSLALSEDGDSTSLIDEIASAISLRNPNVDDLKMLDRVTKHCEASQYLELFHEALGPAPTVQDIEDGLAEGPLPENWWSVRHWVALLPDGIAGDWAEPLAAFSAARGEPPGRDYYLDPPTGGTLVFRSPISHDELLALAAIDCAKLVSAWRSNPGMWPPADPRSLAMELENVVKEKLTEWTASPLTIVRELRHPIYIRSYLRTLAETLQSHDVPLDEDELVDLMVLLRTRPWEEVLPGFQDSDSDGGWRGVDRASINLIQSLANKDLGFGARAKEIRSIVIAEVQNRSEPSGLTGRDEDPFKAAINRPFTQALGALLSVIGYDFRRSHRDQTDAFELLKELLKLDGEDGLHARAIIGLRIRFLVHVAGGWVDENRDLLFGNEAPGDLGQKTVEMALQWGQPCQWLFENCKYEVQNAIIEEGRRSLQQLMLSMLWGWSGYTLGTVVGFLQGKPVRWTRKFGQVAK